MAKYVFSATEYSMDVFQRLKSLCVSYVCACPLALSTTLTPAYYERRNEIRSLDKLVENI